MAENGLGRALRAHRKTCDKCPTERGWCCREYLAISRSFTARRVVVEGPRHRHTWLSVREPSGVA